MTWLIHVTHLWHDSFNMTHSCDACEPWLMCEWDASVFEVRAWPVSRQINHSCVWHDSFICVACLIHMWDASWSEKKNLSIKVLICVIALWRVTWFIHVIWLLHMCSMTRSYVGREILYYFFDNYALLLSCNKCVTWLIHMCDMTHSNVWHDSFTFVTWLIQTCDMTHSYV